ncbi:MAG TPA: elongation factor G [Anaerolineaceae bacterium]|nr:elongation factor G [Longilinea sp.]NMD30205.1 elongation factor G [Chloroflexota bacterium]HNZ00349.1 elongation factor G [Anaerolineaceae bacterium]HOD45190.1 elongation factor G [Anaerolineaceae bacterium]HOH19558.1 elongation factor G [Anaerolineaceae bacterium]
MKEYTTESIRNVAVVSHGSAGKTMLTEAFLHTSGGTTRLGKIEDGTTLSDYDEEEIRRGISIYTSVIPVEYKNTKINFLDTPGYNDFVGEVISALRVSDAALILVDSVAGLEVGTEIAWNYCNHFNLPRFLVINKLERDNASFAKAVASVQEFTDIRLIPVQLPWGEKAAFQGVIDLITMKAFKGDGKTIVDIPADLRPAAEEAHLKLVEAAAEGDDSLMEKYFESGELTIEEILKGLKSGIQSLSFVPVFVTSGAAEIGIIPLLDAIVSLFPSPSETAPAVAQGKDGEEKISASDSGPLAVYVWKTTADPFVGKQTFFRVYSGVVTSDSRIWNQTKSIEERFGTVSIPRGKELIPAKTIHSGDIAVVPKLSETSTGNTLCDKAHPLTLPVPQYPGALYRVAVTPKTQQDSAKLSSTLTRQCEEDVTLSWYNEPATSQTILQGMGDQHIEVAIRRAESRFQVGINTEEPRVPYKETITRKGNAMYRHKKQTGGAGQFGEVHLRVEPYTEGDFDFAWEVFGGAVSQSYANSITKGIQSVMKEGVIAGYPVFGVRVAVTDGKEHPVDSKPIAFEIAGREAFKLAFKEAGPVLLEPIMMVKIVVPENHMGDVLGDLNTRRARVMGMETERGHSTITASVPLAEMQRYTTQLRSITGGRGVFSMEFERYDNVPPHLTQEIVAIHQKELESKKEE